MKIARFALVHIVTGFILATALIGGLAVYVYLNPLSQETDHWRDPILSGGVPGGFKPLRSGTSVQDYRLLV